MRVAGQAAARVRQLLAEAVELVLAEHALEIRAGVDPGGGVALEEDLVATSGRVRAAEEVVEPDLVHGRRRGVGRDVPAHAHTGALGAVHHHRGVPAGRCADAVLHRLVAGEGRLLVRRDGVDVVGAAQGRHADAALGGASQQLEHQVPGAGRAGVVDDGVEGLEPLAGLRGVGVDVLVGQSTGHQRVVFDHVGNLFRSWSGAAGATIPLPGGTCALRYALGPWQHHTCAQRGRTTVRSRWHEVRGYRWVQRPTTPIRHRRWPSGWA